MTSPRRAGEESRQECGFDVTHVPVSAQLVTKDKTERGQSSSGLQSYQGKSPERERERERERVVGGGGETESRFTAVACRRRPKVSFGQTVGVKKKMAAVV